MNRGEDCRGEKEEEEDEEERRTILQVFLGRAKAVGLFVPH